MKKIPCFIQEFLIKNNFKFVKVIQMNEWKGTFILKIKKLNKYYMLKAYSNHTPEKIKNKFNIEKNFYINNKSSFIPKLVLYTHNIFITEFVNGITLREALKNKQITSDLINNLFEAIDMFYLDIKKENFCEEHNFDNAFFYLTSLLFSGPIQVKKKEYAFGKRLFLKVINKILFDYMNFLIKNIDISSLKTGFSHGDFHYNNILILDNKILFIDFENIDYKGFFDFDILYLLAILDINLKYNKNIHFILKKRLNSYLYNKSLKRIYKVYKIALFFNKKYLVNYY